MINALVRGLPLALLLWVPAYPSVGAAIDIRGAGATFPSPIYERWSAQYLAETGTRVSYEEVGSGEGIARIERGLIDFGASDAPLSPSELSHFGLTQFPVIVGGVVPVVNITGIKSGDLKLSGSVLADIYLGKIRKWNDSEIASLNPDLSLPNANITVVHRAESSGTTYLWSLFLSESNPDWKARVGAAKTLSWPVGVADVGNEGVASSVQRTKVSIGYVEYAYAQRHGLSYAAVQNRDGQFVRPGKRSFSAAASSAAWRSLADLDQVLVGQSDHDAWPITGASFILLRATPSRSAHIHEVIKFFDWAFKRGELLALDLDYVPLPPAALGLVEQLWAAPLRGMDGNAIWTTEDSSEK
jgi:phosphate transport system substrate-binding protein